MTAGSLRELLAKVPDGTPVVVPYFDHQYRNADAVVTTARDYGGGHSLGEDFGDEPDSVAIQVVVIQ